MRARGWVLLSLMLGPRLTARMALVYHGLVGALVLVVLLLAAVMLAGALR